MTDTVFIYVLKDPTTGHTRYVGKTKSPKQRLTGHLNDKSHTHRTCWIRSLVATGQKPVLEIIDEVPEEVWPQWEVAYIQFFREEGFDLVNGTVGGEGMNNPTPETRAKMSIARMGKCLPEETCVKMSIAKTGRKHSAEARANMTVAQQKSKHRLGIAHSDETLAKISAAGLGRKHSEEHCAKISAALVGKKHSAERCAINSASQLGKKLSPEHRAKIGAAGKIAWIKRKEKLCQQKS